MVEFPKRKNKLAAKSVKEATEFYLQLNGIHDNDGYIKAQDFLKDVREAVFDKAMYKKDPFQGMKDEEPATFISLKKDKNKKGKDGKKEKKKDEDPKKQDKLSPQEKKILGWIKEKDIAQKKNLKSQTKQLDKI